MNLKSDRKFSVVKRILCSVMLFAIIFSSTSTVFYSPVMAQGSSSTKPNNAPPNNSIPTLVPLWMRPQAPTAMPPDLTGEFQISQTVETGTGDNSFAYNGEPLTYTIVLRNLSADVYISTISLVDTVPSPAGSLDNESLTCNLGIATLTTCTVDSESKKAPLPSGNTIEVTRTKRLKWEIPTLNPGDVITLAFSGQLVGKNEGDDLINYISVLYNWERPGESKTGEEVPFLELTIETRVRPQTDGGTSISKAPVWFAEDWAGGTLTQDWADFDYDGDLDLALGSSLGTLVYHNDNGALKPLWKNALEEAVEDPRLSYGLAWVQLDPATESMELVVVGDSVGDRSTSEGYNYVYSYQPGTATFEQTDFFTTTYQLVRIVPGDFDGDGDIDLIGSTNWVNATCPVRLYRNDGSGHFTDTMAAMNTHHVECVSQHATAALGAGDMDNDGDMDLALGIFPSGLRVLTNNQREVNHPITDTTPFASGKIITIESKLQYIPYDLKWGDFNQDGLLDLAAAYPLEQRARVYKAAGSGGRVTSFSRLTQTLYTKSFMTPLALDWGDFSGDGKLDLIVADFKPVIYSYNANTNLFRQIEELEQPVRGQAWSIRGADISNKHNLDIAITNQSGSSYMFTTLQPKLDTNLTDIPKGADSPGRSDISWGNMDSGVGSDKDLDLILGAADIYKSFSPLLYLNGGGSFGTIVDVAFAPSGFGPHVIAIGDVNNDGLLDFAVGGTYVQIYINPGNPHSIWDTIVLPILPDKNVYSLAWGDANDDGKLDLLVGYERGVYLFKNTQNGISQQPSYTITLLAPASSLAWVDFDDDHFMDFAVGTKGGPTYVYANYGDGTFDKIWQSNQSMNTTSIAWADYDADGDPDLAVGNYGQPIYVWETTYANGKLTLGAAPAWTAATPYNRTSKIAWGDWDSDGYPELAAAKMGERNIVYANINYLAEDAGLLPQWQATGSYSTTAVAWGDADGDGDLDLAVSEATGKNGYYQNTLNGPAHLKTHENAATPLDNNPTYVYVERPGTVADAYSFSTAEILATFKNTPPTPQYISITYTLYDPEGASVSDLSFDYSLDGGGTWSAAPMAVGSRVITQTTKAGVTAVYVWNAGQDKAISDNARFRVCYTPHSDIGNSQHAKRCGISPPFRVRAISCIWPRYEVAASKLQVALSETVYFTAVRVAGQSTSNYGWSFDDGIQSPGLLTTHRIFTTERVYQATFTAQSSPNCEEPRPAINRVILCVGQGCYPQKVYLPFITRRAATSSQMNVEPENRGSDVQPSLTPQIAPTHIPMVLQPQVKTFMGETTMATATPSGYRTQRITDYALGVNSQPSINYDGSRIAFWSTGRFTGQNTDGNIEIFLADIKEDVIEFTQVTSSTGSILAGFNLVPTINYDGSRIAFFSDQDLTGQNPDHNFEVFMAEITASKAISLVQVTQTSRGANTYPSINAKGDLIAFASDVQLTQGADYGEATGYAGIFLAHINKISDSWSITYTTVVSPGRGVNDQPALSADGNRIAFVSNMNLAPVDANRNNGDSSREIFLAEIAGDEIAYTQISVSNHDINESPSIDKNGANIAFMGNPSRQIYVAGITDAPITPMTSVDLNVLTTESGYTYDQPNISADGVRIAYIKEFNEQRMLQVYDTIEGKDLTANVTSGDEAYPAISGDSKDVTYVSNWDIYLTTYPLSDLAITKTNNITAIINPGNQMTYTIVVSNTGPSPAADVILSDTVSVGIQINLTEETPLEHTDTATSTPGFSGGAPREIAVTAEGLEIVDGATMNLYEIDSSWISVTNLAVLWHLNENKNAFEKFVDASGYNRDGYCGQPNCPVIQAEGKIRAGVFFDGINDVIQGSSFNIADNFTIALWAYPRKTAEQQAFIRKPDALGASLLDFGIREGQYRFYLRGSTCITGTVSPEWQHLVVVGQRSGSDTLIKVYKNGEVIGEPVTFTNVLASSINDYIGNWLMGQEDGSPGTAYYHGALDELAIFNRALSPTEIKQIYIKQAPDAASYERGGYFDSRTMEDTIRNGWRSITWKPNVPCNKELPDEKATETGYDNNSDMRSNVLLMHLNDPENLMVFRDSSGGENDADCRIGSCPRANVQGKFNTAVYFEDGQRISVPPAPSLADITVGTWSMWVRYASDNSEIQLNKGQFSIHLPARSPIAVRSSTPLGKAVWTAEMPTTVMVDQWFHVAVVRTGYLTEDVKIYINGTQALPTLYTHTLASLPVEYSDANRTLDFAGYYVDLDEVAIFNQALESARIAYLYHRGTMQIQFQVRACATENCSDNPPFVGPENKPDTYYSELNNTWSPFPAFPLKNLAKPYLQYRTYMGSNTNDSPQVISVSVSPQVECRYSAGSTNAVSCRLSSQIAPLDIAQPITLYMPAQATKELIPDEIDPGDDGFLITNTARISSIESDHELDNDEAIAETNVLFVPITGVTLSCTPSPYAPTGENVTCFAQPIPAQPSQPITYEWAATGQSPFGPTNENSRIYVWADADPEEKEITVVAENPYSANPVSASAEVYLEVKVAHISLNTSSPTELDQTTYFTAELTNNPTNVQYKWLFGDNFTATTTSRTIAHTYTNTGAYNAQVYAYNHVSTETAAANVTVKITPFISVTKTANPIPAQLGGPLTYTIYLTNMCRMPLTNLVITDTLPDSVTGTAKVRTWMINSLNSMNEPGDYTFVTFTVTATGAIIENHVTAASGPTEWNDVATDAYTLTSTAHDCAVRNANTDKYYDNVQDAIAAAGYDHVLQIAGECTDSQPHGESGANVIAYFENPIGPQRLTLRGGYNANFSEPPTGYSTLNANGLPDSRILIVKAGAVVTIENLHIKGGYLYHRDGGGIFIENATVVLTHCLVTGNHITGTDAASYKGGGIYVKGGGILKLYNTEVASNTVRSNNNDGSSGGGIGVDSGGAVTIIGSHIYNNSAENLGGGIYINGSVLEMHNSTVADNTVTSANNGSKGGGIYVYNSANNKKAVTIIHSDIHHNSAKYMGGGIYVENSSNTTINSNTHIYNNSISGGTLDNDGGGGGLCIIDTNMVNISDSEVDHNSVTDSHNSYEGAGIHAVRINNFTLQSSYIHDNNVADNGGGLYLAMSTGVVSRTRFINNHVGPSDDDYDGGGAIDLEGGTITLFNNILAKNSADRRGGAIYINKANVTMRNNTIAENSAGGANAAIYVIEEGGSTVTGNARLSITNTIVTSQTVGIHEVVNKGSSKIVFINGALTQGVSNLTSITGESHNNIANPTNIYTTSGAAIFIHPAGDNYHLAASSPAIDRAVSAQATTTDMDNEPRPTGYPDLGADEYAASFTFTHKVETPAVFPGNIVTYSVIITNTGSLGLNNVTLNVQANMALLTPFTVLIPAGGGTTSPNPPELVTGMPIGYGTSKIIRYAARSNSPLVRNYSILNTATVSANGAATPTGQDAHAVVQNIAPTPVDNAYTLNEHAVGNYPVIANDSDGNNDPLSLTAVGAPSDNNVATPNDGVTVRNASDARYTPNNRVSGYTVSFTYTVSDGALPATGHVVVTVTASNDPPVADDYITTTVEESPVNIPIACNSNLNDPDEEHDCTNLPIAYVAGSIRPTTAGTVTRSGSTFRYDPTDDFTGNAVFTYTRTDPLSAFDYGRITVTVSDINDRPTAVVDTGLTANEDTAPAEFFVQQNDTDPDPGDTLRVIAVSNPVLVPGGAQVGVTSIITPPGYRISYTPQNRSANYTAAFSYTISDPHGATHWTTNSVAVTANDDPPVAVIDSWSMTEDDSPLTIGVLTNDYDPDVNQTTLTLGAIGSPQSGMGSTSKSGNNIIYTPTNRSATYTAVFTYQLLSGSSSAIGTVNVIVTANDDLPTAKNDGVNGINENVQVTKDVLFNDIELDVDQTKQIVTVNAPTVGYGSAITQYVAGFGDVVLYTPANRRGPYSTNFNYTMRSGSTNRTATIFVTITTAINDPIVATNFNRTTAEETTLVVTLVKGTEVTDPDYDDVFTVTAATNNNPPVTGDVTFANHTITYVPQDNYNGTTYITYTVKDSGNNEATGHIAVNVTQTNDPIVADNFTSNATKGVTATLNTTSHVHDPDPGADYTIIGVVVPSGKGRYAISGKNINYNSEAFSGTVVLTYTVKSVENANTDTGLITVTVAPALVSLNPTEDELLAATDRRYLAPSPSALNILSGKALAVWRRMSGARLHQR